MEDGVNAPAGQVLPTGSACSPRLFLSVLQLGKVPTCGCAHFKLLSCTPNRTHLCPYSRHLFWKPKQHPRPPKPWVRDEGARKGRDPYVLSAQRGKPLTGPWQSQANPPLPPRHPSQPSGGTPFITNHPIPSRSFQTDESCAWLEPARLRRQAPGSPWERAEVPAEDVQTEEGLAAGLLPATLCAGWP